MSLAQSIQKIVDEAERTGVTGQKGRQSLKWLVEKARKIKTDNVEFLKSQPTDRYRSASTLGIGRMVVFTYNPKHRQTLPYYDSLPCVFVINIYPEKKAFLGLNLHYLPYRLRAILLDELLKHETNSKIPMNRKLAISWELLKAFAKFELVQPCIKMYLFSQVRSKFIQIPADEWAIVSMLPISKWNKKSGVFVWNDIFKKGQK